MSIVESAQAGTQETPDADRRPRRRPSRRVVAASVVLLLLALSAWWALTTPQLAGGGIAGVSSPDHEVVAARGMREQVFVVPADGPGSSTIAFGIHNEGRLAVELVDVWPTMDEPMCLWQPSERWIQDDPRYLGVLDDRARPAAGAVLAPGASATVWITGAHPDPGGCVHDGITLHDDVAVVARIGGRTSTTRFPLDYTFGYSDDPESLRTSYDVQVLPRTAPAAR